MDYCVSPGGGTAGKMIEESKHARQEATSKISGKSPSTSSSGNKGKMPIRLKDATGHVFTAYLDPTDTDESAQSADTTPAFAGLASDNPQSLSSNPSDSVEYEGWLAEEEEPIMSVNWANNSNPIESVAFSSIAKTNTLPFLCDTGATVHISPKHTDFSNLRSISTKFIRGVGGSSIATIAIRDIKLNLTENDHIILKDVLFVPTSTVRLISVQTLTQDSGVIAHFNEDSCWLMSKTTGNIIA